MFTSKISHKYLTMYLLKKKRYYYFNIILFSVSLVVDATLLVLQYSAQIIIKDYHFVQCR